jgi:hypothetical protein
MKSVVICFILLSLLGTVQMSGCSHEDTTLVTIQIERQIDARNSYKKSILDSIFDFFFTSAYAVSWGWSLSYDSVELTVKGDGMSDITATIPTGSSTFTTEVPSGTDREITVIAYSGTVRNAGKTVVANLGSGEEVTIQMKLLPITTITTLTPGTGEMFVSFNSVEIATGYNIYRSDTVDGPYAKVGSRINGSGPTLSFTDMPVTNGKAYYYKVSIYNGDGEGVQSNYRAYLP